MNNKSEGLKSLLLTFLFRGIGRRFAVYILLFSSIITLFITAIQLLNDYRRDIGIIEDRLQEIQTIYQDTLSTAIWTHNKNGLDLQLDSMMRLPAILYVRVDDELGKKIAQRGDHREQRIIKSSFELSYLHRGKTVLLGQISAYADLDEVYDALFKKLVIILISQGIKTFLVSFFILLLFYLLIGRHLYTMAEVARKVGGGSFKPMLEIGHDDELSDVARSFNNMISKLDANRSHQEELVIKMENVILQLEKEVAERKEIEEHLKISLKEKKTLLQEIHHRVKNNMNVVSSLLKLQANSIDDDRIKEALKESQNRIFTMSAVHETLHGSEDLSEIDLKTYLSKITNSIFQTYSTDQRKVKLENNIDNMPISINQASPLGLIINELLSNSLKYAFPEDRTGGITVCMKRIENELELKVMDDGIGIPMDFDWRNSKSLGLKLVRTLVENQLDGSVDMESKNGTKFIIKFNIDET